MLSMLFLDTLKVEAALPSYQYSQSATTYFTFNALESEDNTSGSISENSGGNGYLNNGSGSIAGVKGGGGTISTYSITNGTLTAHVKVPFTIRHGVPSDISNSDFITYSLNPFVFENIVNGDLGTYHFSNYFISDSNGNMISKVLPQQTFFSPYYTVRLSSLRDSYYGAMLINFFVEYDIVCTKYTARGTGQPFNDFSVTTNISCAIPIHKATESEIESASSNVNDSEGNQHLDEIETTNKSIFSSISDFFGSFFDNLIGIFVPEDGFFSDWFDRLNTLLSDKLGMLYAPFDLLISTLQSIYSADFSSAGIPFPGIKWGDTWLIEPFTFTFDSLGSDFSDLRDKVYFGTDTVLIFTFLILLQKKVRLILEGHE